MLAWKQQKSSAHALMIDSGEIFVYYVGSSFVGLEYRLGGRGGV
jgi:hypothetical protein